MVDYDLRIVLPVSIPEVYPQVVDRIAAVAAKAKIVVDLDHVFEALVEGDLTLATLQNPRVGGIFGIVLFHEFSDVFTGDRGMFVDAVHLDNIPGLFDRLADLIDEMSEFFGYELVRTATTRKGWRDTHGWQQAYLWGKNYGRRRGNSSTA